MLIVAHPVATIKQCNEILVMDQGEIVEKGSHEQLLQQKDLYDPLWEMQQGNFKVREENSMEKIEQHFNHIDLEEISYT